MCLSRQEIRAPTQFSLILNDTLEHLQFVGVEPGHAAYAAFINFKKIGIAVKGPEHRPAAFGAGNGNLFPPVELSQFSDRQAPLIVRDHRTHK